MTAINERNYTMTMPTRPTIIAQPIADVTSAPYEPASKRYMTFNEGALPRKRQEAVVTTATEEATTPVVMKQRPTPIEKPKGLGELRRTTSVVLDPNGQKRYLTDADTATIRAIHNYEFPTKEHLALDRNTSSIYCGRRLQHLETLETIKSIKDPLGATVFAILDNGYTYVDPQLPVTKAIPHDGNHYHREILNTTLIKLSRGFDEPILFRKTGTITPLPILTKRWLNYSAQHQIKMGNHQASFEFHKERLLNDPHHPAEKRSEFDISKGVLPNELQVLSSLYTNLNSAFLFNEYSDGESDPTLGPHAVILRPHLLEQRADGRLCDPKFNHDGLRVDTRNREEVSDTYYPYVLSHNYNTGLYGRFHILTNNQSVRDYYLKAMRELVRDGHIPRGSENWLQLHSLPSPINNTKRYGDNGELLARTRRDG